jgi:hypothetical protein
MIQQNNTHYQECSVVLLPTNKKVNIQGNAFFLNNFLLKTESSLLVGKSCELYILSDDKIEIGDWCYDEHNEVIFQNGSIWLSSSGNKIIATTDSSLNLPQIPQDFIQTFIASYNNGVILDKVLVEYDLPKICENPLESSFKQIKLNSSNEISIVTEQKQMFSREEVVELIHKCHSTIYRNNSLEEVPQEFTDDINNWIQQNLK